MLLTISTTRAPATDLGFLLHKHPDRIQEFGQSYGVARVFYPEASEHRCTVALMLEIDTVRPGRPYGGARGRGRDSADFSLAQYVNDRPYAASSLLAVAIGDVFRTARAGRCKAKPELAETPIPLELSLPALPGGPDLARRLLEPLGWTVGAEAVPLDDGFPEWGDSRYVRLSLTGEMRLADALNHLYVLLPVLDNAKHYWVAADEVDKLIRSGGGWLATHPEKSLITRRYLRRRRALERVALSQLARLAEADDTSEEELQPRVEEDAVEVDEKEEKTPPLAVQRRAAVRDALNGAKRVIDLGCGSGQLITELVPERSITHITGVDVSARALEMAARRLKLDRHRDRITLFQAALTYTDDRLAGYDAAVLMEVIEHIDPPRLAAMERVVFGSARPKRVIVTTPNVEYNVHYEGLTRLRHPDHRFEWDRATFERWVGRVGEEYGYRTEIRPVGPEDPVTGAPTQMGIFA